MEYFTLLQLSYCDCNIYLCDKSNFVTNHLQFTQIEQSIIPGDLVLLQFINLYFR